jgi:hypothetical protein
MAAKQAAEKLEGTLCVGDRGRSDGLRVGALKVDSVPEEAGKLMKTLGRISRWLEAIQISHLD